MINVGAIRESFISTASSYTAITADQKSQLELELATDTTARGYGDKSWHEAYRAFCTGYSGANPEAQGTVAITEWEPDVLKNILLQATAADGATPAWLAIKALQNSGNAQLVALSQLFPEVFTLKAVNLENPSVLAAIEAFKTVGALSDATYLRITQKADPSYQSTVNYPSRSDTLFGDGNAPTFEEFLASYIQVFGS